MINEDALIEYVSTASPCIVIKAPRRSGKTEYLKKQVAALRAKDSELFIDYVALTRRQRYEFLLDCEHLLVYQNMSPCASRALIIDEAAFFDERHFFDRFFKPNIVRIIVITSSTPYRDNVIPNELAFLGFEFIDAPLL